MKIIGGTVSYEDGVKNVPGDSYSTARKVRAEINFAVEDDDPEGDLTVATALDKARHIVNEALGLKQPTAKAKAVKATVAPVATAAVLSDKEKLAVAAGVVKTPKAGIKKTTPVVDDTLEGLDDAIPTDEVTVTDDLDDILGVEAAVEEISDEALLSKTTHYNGATGNAPAIRALALKYFPQDGKKHQVLDIPQEARAEFIEGLKNVPKLK